MAITDMICIETAYLQLSLDWIEHFFSMLWNYPVANKRYKNMHENIGRFEQC